MLLFQNIGSPELWAETGGFAGLVVLVLIIMILGGGYGIYRLIGNSLGSFTEFIKSMVKSLEENTEELRGMNNRIHGIHGVVSQTSERTSNILLAIKELEVRVESLTKVIEVQLEEIKLLNANVATEQKAAIDLVKSNMKSNVAMLGIINDNIKKL